MLFVKAIILGLIEGMTEFIPVSSTAHLLVFSDLLKFNIASKDLFIIVIQLGAIFAVVYEYREILFRSLFGIFNIKNKKENERSWHFALSVLLGFIPFGIAGFVLYPSVKELFHNEYLLLVIGTALIIGGLILSSLELQKKHQWHLGIKNLYHIPLFSALMIGVVQIAAMVPGVSRSGATIVGGLKMNLTKKTATEFSFILAIPVIIGASVYDIYKNWGQITNGDWSLIFVGFVSAYISALFVIRWAVGFIHHHSFHPFSGYRIAAGLFCFLYYFFG